jgi:hypothetical protein
MIMGYKPSTSINNMGIYGNIIEIRPTIWEYNGVSDDIIHLGILLSGYNGYMIYE